METIIKAGLNNALSESEARTLKSQFEDALPMSHSELYLMIGLNHKSYSYIFRNLCQDLANQVPSHAQARDKFLARIYEKMLDCHTDYGLANEGKSRFDALMCQPTDKNIRGAAFLGLIRAMIMCNLAADFKSCFTSSDAKIISDNLGLAVRLLDEAVSLLIIKRMKVIGPIS